MRIRILHTADWHIGDFKGPVKDGRNLRFDDTADCLDALCRKAEEIRPELVLISGDIFHQEQVGPVRYGKEVILASRTIGRLADVSGCVVAMRGTPNHDGQSQWDVLQEILDGFDNVVVTTEPHIVESMFGTIVCIPGFNKQDFRAKYPGLSADEEDRTWTEAIKTMVIGMRGMCKAGKPAFLMSHYTVPGASAEGSQVACFADFEPCIPKEALIAANYDGVFLGHLHRPQQIENMNSGFYSGAVNALRFSDEGQERGFWIHTYEGIERTGSEFVETPYRRFKTIEWSFEDVDNYLSFGKAALLTMGLDIKDCIVRIKYSCTSEQKKRLNVPVLQTELEELGAFYVAAIEAESMIEVNNRNILSEEADPLMCLKEWLEEKSYKDPDKIAELAEPIIAAAKASSTTYSMSGVFSPVSIKVQNYRTYKEAEFDFDNVTFCSINGVNGAGKSSLFMDAISDCLFEITREGDKNSWLRATDDTRSGSIEFVFDIGNQRFRVTRTRTKSGRGTVNISELGENGEWHSLSKEKANDTNKEIERILGMDSMTLRSCALIMQDQYGLFLSAGKDDRIAILAKLLGLGIYDVMELDTRKRLGDAKRELMALKEEERIKKQQIEDKGDAEAELGTANAVLVDYLQKKQDAESRRTELLKVQAEYNGAKAALERASGEYLASSRKLSSKQSSYDQLNARVKSLEESLADAPSIRERAGEYRRIVSEMEVLAPSVAQYGAQKKLLEDTQNRQHGAEAEASKQRSRKNQLQVSLDNLYTPPADYNERIAELGDLEKELAELSERYKQVTAIKQRWQEEEQEFSRQSLSFENAINNIDQLIRRAMTQEKYMKDSGCIDAGNANCKFLAQAKTEVQSIPSLLERKQELEKDYTECKAAHEVREQDFNSECEAVGYDYSRHSEVAARIRALTSYKDVSRKAARSEVQRAAITAQIAEVDKTIADSDENASQLNLRAQELTQIVTSLSESVLKHDELKVQANRLKPFMEKEAALPVLEERKRNAEEQMKALSTEVDECRADSTDKYNEYDRCLKALNELTSPASLISACDAEIHNYNEVIDRTNRAKGAIEQRMDDIRQLKDEVEEISGSIALVSGKTSRYEILKTAFGQDGVPHQIIRNVIPYITDTANNILGSMTGGKMGVEFVLDKVTKGRDGEKATLDVLINEYGKTRLPYASKSGGEKVKASLAVILALAEVKTGAAGIQMGMLFIDEAPFLDQDGTEAYVDALEAIRNRYPDTKIMAITHDENFKARFSQSVTVIKTDDGSKVVED